MSSMHTVDHSALLGHTIDKNRLQFVSILGLGAYGVVYLAKDVSAAIGASSATDPSSPYSGRGYYAVKCLNKSGLDQRQRSFQRREIALHTLASTHENIVSLHRVVETNSVIYVILAYCPDGDLFGMITEQSRYLGNDDLIRSVFLQIIDAVDFCHRMGIYHRDLKPENILCCDKGERVLLADFGLATAEKMSCDFGCGSTFYMSPECQGGVFERLGSYSTLHNDTWSLGVILVNLTCGRNPWKQACPSDETFRAYLDNPDFLRSILPISSECNDLLKRIFTLNPMGRISLSELRHAVLAMPRWTMTESELRNATRATREAARAFAPVDPNAPRPIPGSCDQSQVGSECYPESVNTNTSTAYSCGSAISFPNWSGISDLHRAAQEQRAQAARPLPIPEEPVTQQAPPQEVFKPLPTPPVTPRRRQDSFDTPPVEALTIHSCSSQISSTSSDFCDASSQMDVDDQSGNETPVFQAPSTPKAQIGRPSLANRRKKSFTPPSSGSSSSSGSSWGSLPPTPDTPTFLRGVQHGYTPPRTDINLAVEKMDSILSTTSSKASYTKYYSQYASWASDDEDGHDAILVSPSDSLRLDSAFEPVPRLHKMSVRCA